MDSSPIPGFITRKQAAEQCERAERTLQRYWSRAMEQEDRGVLDHLKLHTEDGDVIDGPDVSKDRIEELKRKGMNPTWFAEADWVGQTYGPRAGDRQEKRPVREVEAPAKPTGEGAQIAESQMAELLRQQLAKREDDIAHLREELNTKNEQIDSANARTRESNVLMQELQRLLGKWQEQAFRTLPAGGLEKPTPPPQTVPDIAPKPTEERGVPDSTQSVPDAAEQPQQKRAVTKRKPARASKPAAQSKPKSGTKKRGAKKKGVQTPSKPKWYEMPTFNKMFRSSSRTK